jgi:hypothetical protein
MRLISIPDAAARLGHRHIMHFILVSIYTGTRKSAALNLRTSSPQTCGGWFDLKAGILYRIGDDERPPRFRGNFSVMCVDGHGWGRHGPWSGAGLA